MAVIRNYGAQGGVIAALEERLPVGMGGFPPCEPRGFAAPRFYTLKSVDEATGVVTKTPVLQCFTAADLAKLPEGRPMWIEVLYSYDKDEWNQFGQKYAKKNVEIVAAMYNPYNPTDEEIAQGYIVLPNDQLWMMARWVTQDADGNDLYGDWGLNEVGVVCASPVYGVGRPLVTMAHDGAVAHVVSPCGTVWLDGVDTKQDEIWMAADKKKHSVTSKVGWAAKPVKVNEDGTVWINSVQFFSESLAAEVDFTSYGGTYEDAKAFADADDASMATAMATALGDGYHIFDVNPYTDMTQGDMTIKSILLDAGGQSTTSAMAWDSDINGGLYRQRIAVGDGGQAYYYGAVGCMCGDGLDYCAIDNSVINYAICGNVYNFDANYATIESVSCGDVYNFVANYATIESVSCGDVGGDFYANYATIESVSCGNVGGDFDATSATIESVSCGDVSGQFYANYATIESVSCGNVGGNFDATAATIESVSCGDVSGQFTYTPPPGVRVESIKVGSIYDTANITNTTVEEVTIGKAVSGYDFSGSNFGKLTVTSTTVMMQTEPPDSVDEILVPAPLVSMYKTDSLFSASFADKIKAM